jgi:hypothetical protein
VDSIDAATGCTDSTDGLLMKRGGKKLTAAPDFPIIDQYYVLLIFYAIGYRGLGPIEIARTLNS